MLLHMIIYSFIIFYSYDWFQTDALVTIVIYTKQKVNTFLRSEKNKKVNNKCELCAGVLF